MDSKKRVGIIGAGPFGLSAAKSMLEQNLLPVVFEKDNDYGGVWREGIGNVWSTMKANASIYSMSYSDFPWNPKPKQIFPDVYEVRDYIDRYVEHFKLKQYIEFNSKVISIRQNDTKKWWIEWTSSNNQTKSDLFDFVVVAPGMYTNPNIPVVEGESNFHGRIIHSKHYNRLKEDFGTLKNKRVLVVGGLVSATEVSVDLAVVERANVVHVFHTPIWIIPRYLKVDSKTSLPYDYLLFQRKMALELSKMKSREEHNRFKHNLAGKLLADQNALLNEDLRMDPNSTETFKLSVSDNYYENVRDGRIKQKRSLIKYLTENRVVFDDDTCEDNIDVVVWCTGYRLYLDFMEKDTLQQLEYDLNDQAQPLILYKSTFRPELENIAFVGLIKEPLFNVGELQSRWASLIFSGKVKLPDKAIIEENYKAQRDIRSVRPRVQLVNENFTFYADEIAREFDALPDFDEIKKINEKLYKQLLEGAAATAHYRLHDKYDMAISVIESAQKDAEAYSQV